MIHTPLNRVGIVMMSAVGDVVHVLPVIHAIKRHTPASRITWVLQPGPAALVRGHPLVDEIIEFDRQAGLRGFRDVRQTLAATPFDVVLNLQVYFKAGVITSFTKAPIKLGFDRQRARDGNWLFTTHRVPARSVGQHVQDQYFEFLEALGIEPHPVEWGLGPWAAEREWQRTFFAPIDRPAVALVIATSKPQKDWLPDRWASIVDVLYHDYGVQPILVGGQSERELHAQHTIMEKARHKPLSALGSGLRKLVSILDGAALVMAPDTGPLHMAVALDRPVISLMGYTNPKRTGPYRRFHDLIVDAYGDPGENYPLSAQTREGRMSLISVDDVLEKVERWQHSYAAAKLGPSSG